MQEQDNQRKSEWLKLSDDKQGVVYHQGQFNQPFRSTVFFCDWLESLGLINAEQSLEIVDIGAGSGANIFYMAQRFPNLQLTGIELNPDLVNSGNAHFDKVHQKNCCLIEADMYHLSEDYIRKFDGVISYQTLSWLPEYKTPLEKMTALAPKWIAITSLFYDGEVNFKIEVQDYTRSIGEQPYVDCYYNIYSIPRVREWFVELGYADFKYIPFEIDIDLPKPKGTGMGTYTKKLDNEKRIQISGSIWMNWHFIVAQRGTEAH